MAPIGADHQRPVGGAGFPGGFWWGTGASATQTEGAAPQSDWWAWEQAGRAPRSGDGNGFLARYTEDFALLAGWGLRHHRLSLDWARLEPEPGRYDAAAVECYRAMLTAGRKAGLCMWVCLLHGALPAWFAAGGGFLGETADTLWARHVDFVADTFGDLVYGWKPINGPSSFAAKRYLTGQFPPGHTDMREFQQALRALHSADFAAAGRLHGTGRPVASVEALAPVFPADNTAAAQAAAAMLDAALWDSWLTLARTDAYHEAFDFVGFSYYSAARVDGAGRLLPYPPGHPPGPQGYVRWAEGIRMVLDRLAAELPGRRYLVAELGYGGSDDQGRTDYLRAGLDHVRAAITDGIDVAGVFFWTGVDNYEWIDGYHVPFGLFDRDRRPKASAHFVRELIKQPDPRNGDSVPP